MFPVHLNNGESEIPKDDIFYVIAQNGIHLRKKTGLIDSMAPVDRISILQPIESYASMDIKKIPLPVFANILGFFRKVFEEYRSECVVILHYNEKNGNYKVEVPPQKVGPGSLDYTGAQNYRGYTRVGTIHSHAAMGAFHSGTDDHDEEHFDGIHITLGNMRDVDFGISSSIVCNGLRIMIEPEDYIDGVSQKEDVQTINVNGVDTVVTTAARNKRYLFSDEELGSKFPKAWFKRVESIRIAPRTYVYGGNYGKHGAAQAGNRHFQPGFNTGGYVQRGGSRVFTPGRNSAPGGEEQFRYGFRNEDYEIDPCTSCVFSQCAAATGGKKPALADMDTDDVLRYVFANFDEDEIVELGLQMFNLDEPADVSLTDLLTTEAEVGAETSGIEIGLDEIPPSMIKDGE